MCRGDNWQGDSNPGHKRRLALWRAIEAEFGEPLANVIQGLREQDGGNSWRTVAGCLGVSLSTLQEWRKALDLPLNLHDQVYDPSSTPELTPTDRKAQALGYENATDAVLDMRLREGLTTRQAGKKLGVHWETISRYTPPEMRSEIYNRSEEWWKQRREQCAAMTEQNRVRRSQDKNEHPFNYANNLIFKGEKNE